MSALPGLAWDNQGLFSNHYLLTQFPHLRQWDNSDADLRPRFDALKRIYAAAHAANVFNTRNEQQTEDVFIRPVLRDVLGWQYDPQMRANAKAPDYGLFLAQGDYRAAKQDADYGPAYYARLGAVAEAKYWGRELNTRDRNGTDLAALADPTAQTVGYLDAAAIRSNYRVLWAILTNGQWWRLFFYRAKSITSNFYQVDVGALCAQDDFAGFRYFYGMFSVAALAPDARGRRWLDAYLDGSARYAEEVSTKLRDVIFGSVFENLAQGLVASHHEKTRTQITGAEEKTLVFRATLTLLYRILFLLYAESRDLLPVNDLPRYGSMSLRTLCERLWQGVAVNAVFTSGSCIFHDLLKGIFKVVDRGNAQLNVPRYNGGLFAHCAPHDEADPVVDIEGARFLAEHEIADQFMAEALKGLVFDLSEPDVKRFYDYSSLDVQHLGTIYEGLLEFSIEIATEPMLAVPEDGTVKWKPQRLATAAERAAAEATRAAGEVMLVNTRGERKCSGAYYTPQCLVSYAVQQTVAPRVEAALAEAEAFWRAGGPGAQNPVSFTLKLFDITVCDPAMGSGHFLVHTVDVIADMLSRWHGEHPDSPLAAFLDGMRADLLQAVAQQGVTIDTAKLENRHLIRRMVLKRCIFGVDINPMAVELTKLSLWLHSFTIGAPLSFLDHHIKCGNSLIGERDLDAVIAIGSPVWHDVLQAMHFMFAIDRLNDVTYAEVAESKHKYDECRDKLLVALNRAHVTTARFFVDELADNAKRGQVINLVGRRRSGLLRDAPSPQDGTYDLFVTDADAPEFHDAPRENVENLRKALAVAMRYRFFHWKLEFPDVFIAPDGSGFAADAGFDCVIGNPPWERMKLQETEFFAARAPDIAAAPTAAKRRQLIERLPETNPALAAEYHDALAAVTRSMDYIRKSKLFPLLGKGDLNLYAVMLERAVAMTKPTGRTGFLTPSGIATDSTAQEFFRTIVEQQRLHQFIDFENKKVFFPDVHASFRFAISIIGGMKNTSATARCAFFIHDMAELDDPTRTFDLTAADFALLNPNTKTCPIFRTRRDAELVKQIYQRVPVLINEADEKNGNPWQVRFMRMFDMTNDSHLFRTAAELEKDGFWRAGPHLFKKDNQAYVPLYEAKMIHHYDHRFSNCVQGDERIQNRQASQYISLENKTHTDYHAEARFWVALSQVSARLEGGHGHKWMLGFRDITNATNERTCIAAFFPLSGVGNNMPLMLSKHPAKLQSLLIANLSSFALDAVARTKVIGTHINFFILQQFPVLPPKAYAKPFHGVDLKSWIGERVLKLVYTADDMKGFAHDMGFDGPPFVWDEEERLHLRCQLDALFFHLYGLSREETDYVMETFPIVRKNDLERCGAYRTKDLILHYWNAYAAGDLDARVYG
jgi:hypothetical protein